MIPAGIKDERREKVEGEKEEKRRERGEKERREKRRNDSEQKHSVHDHILMCTSLKIDLKT